MKNLTKHSSLHFCQQALKHVMIRGIWCTLLHCIPNAGWGDTCWHWMSILPEPLWGFNMRFHSLLDPLLLKCYKGRLRGALLHPCPVSLRSCCPCPWEAEHCHCSLTAMLAWMYNQEDNEKKKFGRRRQVNESRQQKVRGNETIFGREGKEWTCTWSTTYPYFYLQKHSVHYDISLVLTSNSIIL